MKNGSNPLHRKIFEIVQEGHHVDYISVGYHDGQECEFKLYEGKLVIGRLKITCTVEEMDALLHEAKQDI